MVGCMASGEFGCYRQVTWCPFKQLYKPFLKSLVAALHGSTKHLPTFKTNVFRGRLVATLIVLRCSQCGIAAPSLAMGHMLQLPLSIVRMNLHQFIHPHPQSAPSLWPVAGTSRMPDCWLQQWKRARLTGLDLAKPVFNGQRTRKAGVPSTETSLAFGNSVIPTDSNNQKSQSDSLWAQLNLQIRLILAREICFCFCFKLPTFKCRQFHINIWTPCCSWKIRSASNTSNELSSLGAE